MKILRIRDSEDHITREAVERSTTNLIPAGSVLLVTRSGILRHSLPVAINEVPVTINQDLKALIPSLGVVPAYLVYAIQAFESEILAKASKSGTTVQSIEFSRLLCLELPIAPTPEQERIVREIEKQTSRINAAVNNLNRVRIALKRYRASVLKAAVEGRLVPTEAELARVEERGYEPADQFLRRVLESAGVRKIRTPPIVGELSRQGSLSLPAGWILTSLAELKRFSLYGPRFSSEEYALSGKVVVRTSDISEGGKVDTSSAPRLPLAEEEFFRYKVERGDLLFTRTGSLGTLAVFYDVVDAIPGAYLIQYRLQAPIETTWYLFHFFRSPEGQRALLLGGAGVGRPNLNAPTIEAIPIPLPPWAEQQRITKEIERQLSVIDKLELTVNFLLGRTETLRRAILRDAFAGKLSRRDEEDESVSVLLEQIRKARQSAVDVRPRRGRGVTPVSEIVPVVTQVFDTARPTDVEEVPVSRQSNFLDLPRDEQIDHLWESLLGQGPLDKDAAIRTAAQSLRDQGLVRFQRLREGGPLYAAIATALDRGVREGSFDRPKRGHIRAILPDAKSYTSKEWKLCLLQSLDGELVPQDDALRIAAEWARETLGLDFARLREDGVILRGLRTALEEAVKAGEVIRRRGVVSPAPKGATE